ncbi:MAG: hypothetical protein BJ554DRAFT_6523 [Olpidium bornovanus]|uniref:Uncharacterized protein n=1 Tax=Olpidium bornovanus TaxID=278681 RepID=A0A8H8DK44_9FUNG|nr:MAG: hypothetical protein BJ554DRAFT_6523 [Olpidium bornovanus]
MSVGGSLNVCVSGLQDAVDSVRRRARLACAGGRASSCAGFRAAAARDLTENPSLPTAPADRYAARLIACALSRVRQSISASLQLRFDDILLRAEDILTCIEDEANAVEAKFCGGLGMQVRAASLKKPIKNGTADKVVAAMSNELTSARRQANELKRSLARATSDKRRLEGELKRARAGAKERAQEVCDTLTCSTVPHT